MTHRVKARYPQEATNLVRQAAAYTSTYPAARLRSMTTPRQKSSYARPQMCYQVFERYIRCRCLYYKHAIDPCAAHGQRGHGVQTKTVLVGYACPQHQRSKQAVEIADIVENISDLDDSSDDGASIFSTSIALSRSTSFIASEGQDTIAEVLKVLLEDPELRWEKLVRSPTSTQLPGAIPYPYTLILSNERYRITKGFQASSANEMKVKNVQFFLGAFERDLRAEADSTLQHHACAFLRQRLRYLSSKIYEHFNTDDIAVPGAYLPGEKSASGSLQQLHSIDLDETDPALMPAFCEIREFVFKGTAYETLKENIRNFAQRARNYEEELAEILVKNIHPPTASLRLSFREDVTPLCNLLSVFLSDLAREAELYMLSASDRVGINGAQNKPTHLSSKIVASWTDEAPLWHFYPLIHGNRSCLSSMTPQKNSTEIRGKVEAFERFVCSSRAFWNLTRSFAPASLKNVCEPSHVLSSKAEGRQSTGDKFFSAPRIVEIKFGCVSSASCIS